MAQASEVHLKSNESKSSKIWIDGCFDFAHHGHAGAMMQARQHGTSLIVGVHSDEEILSNKGPTVMNLAERIAAVEGCRWCTTSVPGAPYVTDPAVMDDWGCQYVVHGDDITTDKDGKDCYEEVKQMGRFIVVKRTPNISTTDLVGRMLLYSKDHHLPIVTENDWDLWFKGNDGKFLNQSNIERYKMYATGPDAKSPGAQVWLWTKNDSCLHDLVEGDNLIWNGTKPIYYIDGAFDLFNPGHILALKNLKEKADNDGALVVVGIVDDKEVNKHKGKNYPIMNIFERSLCVLQSKYIDGIILGAPFVPTMDFIGKISRGGNSVVKIFHGCTGENGAYEEVKQAGLLETLPRHQWNDMTVESIVERVLKNREVYEERQRKKGWKAEHEVQLKNKEEQELAE